MRIILLLTICITVFTLSAQDKEPDYTRLPDKVFIHLDKNLYSPGDTIWAKAYAFHRNNFELSDNSYALHLQIVSEDGVEVDNYKMLMVDGMGYGQIPVYETMKPGFYQIIAHTGHMKNFGQQFFFKTTIEVRKQTQKVSVKTYFDKEHYRVGDTAKITFHLYDEFQTPMSKQRFRYEFMHLDNSLKKGGLRTSEDGTERLLLPLIVGSKKEPPFLKLTYYNDENGKMSKPFKVYVPMVDDILHLAFYPESGDMIEGVASKIAFEALDDLGEAVAIEGLLQENDTAILIVSSLHKGRGFFSLIPRDAKYTFKVTKPAGIDSIFELPQVLKKGYNLCYVKQDENSVFLQVIHNCDEDKMVKIWISQYDQLVDVFDLEVQRGRHFAISKTMLPQGLVTLTLTDENDNPQGERLIYIPVTKKSIKVSLPESVYSQRKKVKVKLTLEDASVKAHLSVAVVDSILAKSPYLELPNIKAYALLGTELRGKINNINTYLEETKQADVFRDLLLLTHGWRRYSWIANQRQLDSLNVVNFNKIGGLVKHNRKPQSKAKMTAMVLGNVGSFSEFVTDMDGRFCIQLGYQDRSSQKILLMAKSSKGKENVSITLQNTDTISFAHTVECNKDNVSALMHDYNNYVDLEDDAQEEVPFLSYETKLLKELVIYGERVDPNAEDIYSEAVTVFSAGSVSGEDLMGGYSFVNYVQQASIRVQYNSTTDRIVVRSRGGGISSNGGFGDEDVSAEDDVYDLGAEIYVDGMAWGKDASALDFLTKEDISEIVVLDPESAQVSYGTEGEYGVILVRTNNNYMTRSKNTLNRNMTIFGRFIASKEFYEPIYETMQQDSLVIVDNRITLHWEPFVTTDENGEASFDFYTDDISGAKQIIIQGIDDEGNLYYQTSGFDVKGIGY